MFQRIRDEITRWFPWSPSLRVVMLGVEYDATVESAREAFIQDFHSRLQLTYRRGFSTPLKLQDKEIDSDAGWGCMLRVIQMILAQSFINFTLGREWRFEESRDLEQGSLWLQIVSCFLDTPEAPFSLHKLVETGESSQGKEPSSWFGPTSSAKALGSLFKALPKDVGSSHTPAFLSRFGCVVFEDGAIFKASVLEKFSSGCEAVLLLVCRRLGLDNFNEVVYRSGIEACFELPQFLGLASGNNGSSAHYFVATHDDDNLLYLDPHTVQPALDTIEDARGKLASGLHAPQAHPLRWARLNPSICFGFLVHSSEDFLTLCGKLSDERRGEVFEVLEKEPMYTDFAAEEDGDMVVFG